MYPKDYNRKEQQGISTKAERDFLWEVLVYLKQTKQKNKNKTLKKC